jgi:two-component system OmpR family response regulator
VVFVRDVLKRRGRSADHHHGIGSPAAHHAVNLGVVGGVQTWRHSLSKVMIVEDDTDMLDLMSMRLLVRGHDIVTATSGEQALSRLPEVGPLDAYVLDVGLPGVDGYELAARLRAVTATDTPVIFVTAFSSPWEVSRGRSLGNVDYLTKPVEMGRLLRAVDVATVLGR